MKISKISNWIKIQFTTLPTIKKWSRVWDWTYTAFVIGLIFSNFYLGFVTDNHYQVSLAIWQMCTLAFYWLLDMVKTQKDWYRDMMRDSNTLLDSQNNLLDDQQKLLGDMQQTILDLSKENADLKKQINGTKI